MSVEASSDGFFNRIRATSTATFPFPTIDTFLMDYNLMSSAEGWPLYQYTNCLAVMSSKLKRFSPGEPYAKMTPEYIYLS